MSERRHRSIDTETIEAMAAAWLAQRDEGLSAEEAADFARWQQADPRHAAAVARIEKTWAALQSLRDFRPAAARHPDRDLLARTAPRSAWRLPALAAAAVALAAIALAIFYSRPAVANADANAPRVFATTVDGYQRVTLEDGSLVELNASSEVEVDFSGPERRVQLRRGEAHFTVAKNKQRPFLVRTDNLTVRAVGTEFNVRLAERNVEVLVTEGRVKVEPPKSADTQALADLPTLAAGQRVSLPPAADWTRPAVRHSVVIENVSPAAIREALAWQGPRLVFVDEPLREVVAQFNRVNQVQIVLGDPELGAQSVAGSFRAENVEAFVRLLTTDGDIVAERPDANHIRLRRNRAGR